MGVYRRRAGVRRRSKARGWGATATVVGGPELLSVSGALTFDGTEVKQVQKAHAGAVTFVGAEVKRADKLMAGAVTFAGALANVRTALVNLAGAVTFDGALVKQAQKGYAGAVTFTGTLTKQAQKLMAGAVTFVGSGAHVRTVTQALAGAITFAGSLTKQANLTPSGAVTFSGGMVKSVNKGFTGAVTFGGSLGRTLFVALSGAITFSGSVANEVIAAVTQVVRGLLDAPMRAVAVTLQNLFGEDATITYVSASAFDPLDGTVDRTLTTEVEKVAVHHHRRDGTPMEHGTLRLTFAARSLNQEPAIGDTVSIGSDVYEVIEAVDHLSGHQKALLELVVRR